MYGRASPKGGRCLIFTTLKDGEAVGLLRCRCFVQQLAKADYVALYRAVRLAFHVQLQLL
jgi:hypothetical protein